MSSNEVHESAPNPVSQPFPLAFEDVAGPIRAFGGFNSSELELIEKANFGLLEADDPIRYVLEEQLRPDLLDRVPAGFEHDARLAYRAGVCVGAAIMRQKLQSVEITESDNTPKFDLAKLTEDRLKDSNHRLEHGMTSTLVGRFFGESEDVYDFSGYFANPDYSELQGYLHGRWLGRMPFLKVRAIEAGVDDFIAIGMKDTFTAFASMYGQPEPVDEKAHVYDRRKHRLLTDRRYQNSSHFVLTALQFELDPTDLESEENTVGLLQRRHIESGYKGTQSYLYGPPSDPSSTKYAPEDRRWGNRVPTGYNGFRISHIHRFMTGYVMRQPGKSDAIEPVVIKDTEHTTKLSPHDVLILRGREGRFFSLPAPFTVYPELVDEATSSVELFSLCRLGSSYPLAETTLLSEFDKERFEKVKQEVLERQRNQNPSWLGRLAVNHPTAAKLAPVGVVAGVGFVFNAFESPVNIVINGAAAAAVVAGYLALMRRVESNIRIYSATLSELDIAIGALTEIEEKITAREAAADAVDAGEKSNDEEQK